MAGRRSRSISTTGIAAYLEGIDFPKSRDELVEIVEDREAPDEIIDFLEKLPDQVYSSHPEVISAVDENM